MEAEDQMVQPITLADDGFDLAVERYDLMVVDFWAPWCGPCMVMTPALEELAEEYAGRVTFGKLNTDENPATTERFGVMGIPTLLILQGGNEVERIVGAVPKQEIRSVLDRYLQPG
jgi:thioredoxin 1